MDKDIKIAMPGEVNDFPIIKSKSYHQRLVLLVVVCTGDCQNELERGQQKPDKRIDKI